MRTPTQKAARGTSQPAQRPLPEPAMESIIPTPLLAELINVLVVDDEPANLAVLEAVLDDPCYRLVRAHSADEALMALMQQEFAVLILDIRMPGMTGFELAQMVKERKKTSRIPIIFLTAYYDQDQHILEGYGSGAVDYLNKPVNPAVLRSKVSVFADLHRKSREVTLANLSLMTEVAERRRAEEELRALNESLELRVVERTEALRLADHKLKLMMESITDGLLMLDAKWRFAYINEQGARLLGMQVNSLIGKNIWEMSPSMTTGGFYDAYVKAVQTRQTLSFEGFCGEPLNRWLECHCYPSDEGLSVYFHDITDRRAAQGWREQLLAAEQAARTEGERVARAKDEFLTSLSHELRTPLAAILGWAAVLKKPMLDEEAKRRGIDAIVRNAQAQTHLVAELLDMSRIVSGKLRMNVEEIDLDQIAEAAVDTVRPLTQAKGVVLNLSARDNSEKVLLGDSDRLEQVVSNLIGNALKFTPSGGTITIETRSTGSEIGLTVSDTGEGISADFLPHLFDRFSQGDGSAARVHGGLGLGLSIVKNLVELHSGTIVAKSEGKGHGAIFDLTFPRACDRVTVHATRVRNDALASTSDVVVGAEADLGGLRVLIVDDHADVLEVERRLLCDCGACVSTAGSGEDALELLRNETFDVLLSDLGMPGMDGYTLMEIVRGSLRLSSADLPAAALTAFVRQEDRQRALGVGFQSFIQKPASPRDLTTAVLQLSQRGAAGSR
jgi:signal transduction histidine kinase/response regulator RpfG family c-di-GMP phosphodiesterase